MLRQFILLIICSALLFTAAVFGQDEKRQPYEDAESYQIYSLLIAERMRKRGVGAEESGMIYIQAETDGSYKMCLQPKDEYPGVKAAIADYLEANKKPRILQNKFTLKSAHKMLTLEDIKPFGEIYTPVAWEAFSKQYPKSASYLQLAAIGYNQDRTIAVVYLVDNCGRSCTYGNYYVLQKTDGKWNHMDWDGIACGWAS